MGQSNMQYNEDELHPPKWLNTTFFEKVLRHYENCDDVQIEKFKISPGSGKGDHYASVMFRAKVKYCVKCNSENVHKCKSLILKTMPDQDGMKKDLLNEAPFFQTEINMYSEILPKMQQILKAVGDETELSAKIIYTTLEPHQCLIFEDLVEKGYTTITNRTCTLDEVNIAFGKLARIHAASYKLLESGYKEFLDYKSGFNKNTIDKFEFLRDGVIDFKEYIRGKEDLRKYVPYVEKVEKHINAEIGSYFEPQEVRSRNGILVLNHGDFHMKNMMVKYNDDVLENLMLVDYQISYYAQSALDLLYGYVMMLSPEMRANHRNEIFSKYFETFQETLKKIHYTGNIPTKCDFDAELQKYKHWELFLIMSFLIYNHAFTDNSIELSDLAENRDFRRQFWQKENVLNEIRWQLPRLVEEGYFD